LTDGEKFLMYSYCDGINSIAIMIRNFHLVTSLNSWNDSRLFWTCFVSVSFQFYFNCADSFTRRWTSTGIR